MSGEQQICLSDIGQFRTKFTQIPLDENDVQAVVPTGHSTKLVTTNFVGAFFACFFSVAISALTSSTV